MKGALEALRKTREEQYEAKRKAAVPQAKRVDGRQGTKAKRAATGVPSGPSPSKRNAEVSVTCPCGKPITHGRRRGSPREYCSPACKQKAYRARG